MKRSLSSAVCAVALFCAGVPAITLAISAPAQAQYARVSFDSFHDELSQFGQWVYSDRWGSVWVPDAGPDFRPYYSDGYWANTIDYGWTWISDQPWGDITFHYGRWVDDPYDGWMWIPGYVWSPAWVVWRSNDDMMGWMPMPPDRDFLGGSVNISGGGLGFAVNFNNADDYYGYRTWYGSDFGPDQFAGMWAFVDVNRFGDRDFRRYARPTNYNFIRSTTNITNYTVVNNIIVNRSIDPRRFDRAGGRRFEPQRADRVLRNPGRVTNVEEGRRVERQMRDRMPQGNGRLRSAPRPNEMVANALSDRRPDRGGGGPGRLQTRQDVERASFGNQQGGLPDDRRGQVGGDERKARDPQRQEGRVRDQREAQDRQGLQRQAQQRQEQERVADQQRQQQERTPGDRKDADLSDNDRGRSGWDRSPKMRQEQGRFARQRAGQQQDQAQAQQSQQRQQQEQARNQQMQQERQQQEQARAQQDQQREQARNQQMQQQRQQQEQARAQQEQAGAQQQQQRQQEQQARQQQRAQQAPGSDPEPRGRGRGRDRDE